MQLQESVNVTKRFFQAIDALILLGEIRGLKTFCTKYQINRGNLQKVKDNPMVYALQTEYMVYIIKDYWVSAHWLMTGDEHMFENPVWQKAYELKVERKKTPPFKYRYGEKPYRISRHNGTLSLF